MDSIIYYSGAKPLPRLDRMPSMKMCPNVVTYNAAISSCEKGSQWQLALHLLWTAVGGRVSPDIITYSAAMSACETEGQWQTALQLFQIMNCKSLLLDVISFNVAISSSEKGSQWCLACSLLEETLCQPTGANIVSFNSALNSCASCAEWDVALQLVWEMPSRRIQPNVLTGTELINALVLAGQSKLGAGALHELTPRVSMMLNLQSSFFANEEKLTLRSLKEASKESEGNGIVYIGLPPAPTVDN